MYMCINVTKSIISNGECTLYPSHLAKHKLGYVCQLFVKYNALLYWWCAMYEFESSDGFMVTMTKVML